MELLKGLAEKLHSIVALIFEYQAQFYRCTCSSYGDDRRLTGLIKQAWLENGCVYGYRKTHEWQKFLQAHNLEASMSSRGNCHVCEANGAKRRHNAVAESLFQPLKRERVRRRTYRDRAEARQDVFDYIEFFYNPKRKHGNDELLSPIEFEQQ